MLPRLCSLSLLLSAVAVAAQGPAPRVVVLEQPGFPTVASEPIPHEALAAALPGATFASLDQLRAAGTLNDTFCRTSSAPSG